MGLTLKESEFLEYKIPLPTRRNPRRMVRLGLRYSVKEETSSSGVQCLFLRTCLSLKFIQNGSPLFHNIANHMGVMTSVDSLGSKAMEYIGDAFKVCCKSHQLLQLPTNTTKREQCI